MKQPKNQWGLVIGRPNRLALKEYEDLSLFLNNVMGKWAYDWDGDQPYLALFDTREQARAAVKRFTQTYQYWYFYPRKYTP